MSEFYRIAFATFSLILAAVSIASGANLISEGLKGKIGDKATAVMGGLTFLVIGLVFGWLAVGLMTV